MSKVTFYLGIRSLYDANEYEDGLYFATDTQELLLNDLVYGAGAVTGMTFNADSSAGTLTLTSKDGTSITVEITGATASLAGLMTASDKSELSTATTNISSLLSSVSDIESNYAKKTDIIDSVNTSGIESPLILDGVINGETLTLTGGVDLSDYATLSDLSKKLDTLTAGEGISISNNTISCTLSTDVFKIVDSLPTSDIDTNIIYVVPSGTTGDQNQYTEYIYVNGGWEKLGEFSASVDLSNYYTKDETYSRSEIENLIGESVPTLSSLGGVGTVNASGTSPLTLSASKSGTTVTISGSVDLSDYAKTSDIPTLSDLNGVATINASGTSPLTLTASKSGTTVTISGTVDAYSKSEIDSTVAALEEEISTAAGGGITGVNVSGTSPLTLNGSVSNGVATITGSVDLSNYATTSLINTLTAAIDDLTATEGADFSNLTALINGKLDTLTAGNNITISGNTISATDTTYTAGSNITISSSNVISANYSEATTSASGLMSSSDKSTLDSLSSNAVTNITANGTSPLTLSASKSGNSVTISGSVDTYNTTYIDSALSDLESLIQTAAQGGISSITASGTSPLTLSANVSGTSATITGSVDLSSYANKTDIPTKVSDLENDAGYITESALDPYALTADLASYVNTTTFNNSLSAKLDVLTAGSNITISDNVISATSGITNITASGTDPLTLSASISNNTANITGSVNLSNYVTNSSLNTTLANYVTNSSLSGTLTDYVTTELLNEAIEGLTPDPGTGTVTSVTAKNEDETGILAFSGTPTIGAVTLTASIKEDGLKSFVEDLGYAKESDIPTLSDLGGIGTISASGTSPLTLSASKSGTSVSITGSVDLSDYAKTSDLSSYAKTTDLSDYAKTSDIPTATSDLVNDSGFITSSALSDYATETYVNNYVTTLESEINAKLDKLTAGEYITISDNIISADLSSKQDTLNYYSEESTTATLNPGRGLTVSTPRGSVDVTAGAAINLNPSDKLYYNEKEVATVDDIPDVSDKQDKLKYYSEGDETAQIYTLDKTTIDADTLYIYTTKGVEYGGGSVNLPSTGEITMSVYGGNNISLQTRNGSKALYNDNEIATVADFEEITADDIVTMWNNA